VLRRIAHGYGQVHVPRMHASYTIQGAFSQNETGAFPCVQGRIASGRYTYAWAATHVSMSRGLPLRGLGLGAACRLDNARAALRE